MAPARSPLQIALLVVAVVALVTAGGYALLTDESQRPSQAAIDNASERSAALDGFAAVRETTVRMGGDNTTGTVQRVVARPGTGKYRAEAVGGTTSGYDLTVSNGTTLWLYDRENETVRRVSIDNGGNNTGVVLSGQYVERVMDAAFDDSNETTSGISALPMVSSGAREPQSGELPTNGSSLRLNASYLGTEETNGRQTYVFELTQSDSGQIENYSARIWVDAEWFVGLRQRTNFTFDGTRYVSETEFRNVTFDPDLGDVSFRFEPPADANVTTVSGPSYTQYESRDALASNASLSVPDPDLPGEFEFDQGALTEGQGRSVTLQYTNGSASMSVTVRNSTDAAASEGTDVRIGETTGRLDTFGATSLVSWQCEDRSYTVIGSNVGNETVVDVAESIGCE